MNFTPNLDNEFVVLEIKKELKNTALLVVKRSIEKRLGRKIPLQKEILDAGDTRYEIKGKFHNGVIIG